MSESLTFDGFVILDDDVTHSILDSNSDDLYYSSGKTGVTNIKNTPNLTNVTNDLFYKVDNLKGHDSNTIIDVVECDSTTPTSLEKVELDNECNENENDNLAFPSYPVTLIDSYMCNVNESTNEIENTMNNVVKAAESVPCDNFNIVLLTNALNEHDELHRNDIPLEEISEKDSMTTMENHGSSSIVKSSNEMNTNLDVGIDSGEDRTDFRINILDRNDEENKWSTNQYIQQDNEENKCTMKEEISESLKVVKNQENVESIDMVNKLSSEGEENDVGIRTEKEDNWSTNQYLQDDKEETQLSQKDENIKANNEDKPDFRVNIFERNDRVDTWLTNQHIYEETEDRKSISNIENEFNPISTIDDEFECDANKTLVDAKLCISDRLTDLAEYVSDCRENPLVESDSKSGNKEDIETTENVSNLMSNQLDNDQQSPNAKENIITDGNERQSAMDVGNRKITQETPDTVPLESSDVAVSVTGGSITAVTVPPLIGVSNPINFPAMIAVISVLFNCTELRCGLIDYHHSDEIVNFDIESSTDISPEDVFFMNNLCKLFVEMKASNDEKIIEIAGLIRNYFKKKKIQLDFLNGFNYFLKVINTVTKSVVSENENFKDTDDIMFDKFSCKNKGFVTDSFCGQIKHKTFCKNCQKIYSEEYEQTYSLFLKLPLEKKSLSLEKCIQSYLSDVKIEITKDHKCCNNPSIWANKEFTHTPDYLILCIDRNLENQRRDRTFIETDTGVFLNSKQGAVLYSLRSVIDEILMNNTAFNSVKCLSDFWYMIESKSVKQIGELELINEYNVGFMFKKLQDY